MMILKDLSKTRSLNLLSQIFVYFKYLVVCGISFWKSSGLYVMQYYSRKIRNQEKPKENI